VGVAVDGQAGIDRYEQAGESRQRHGSGVICIGAEWVESQGIRRSGRPHGEEHEAQSMPGLMRYSILPTGEGT
jgi:hypothetical protein